MPAGAYDREAGLRAFHGMVERSRYAEELGFDWVSVSEHHYSPRILTPSLPIAATYIARARHQDRAAGANRAAEQSGTARRGNGDARYDGRGPADRRHAARHHQRNADLRPQP